jgi:hypothetical protein
MFDPNVAWARLGTRGKVAAGVAGLALIVLGVVLPGFVRAVMAPSAGTQSNAEGDAEISKKHAERFPGYLAQIEGRSLFLVPGPPSIERSAGPPPDDEPKDKPKPTSYGGPSIVAMMNDAVWFSDGKRLQAGSEKEGDVRVVAVNIPWEATVEWQGVEFKVGLFTRDSLVIKAEGSPAALPDVDEEPEAEAANETVATPLVPKPAEVPMPAVQPGAEPTVAPAASPATPSRESPPAPPPPEAPATPPGS